MKKYIKPQISVIKCEPECALMQASRMSKMDGSVIYDENGNVVGGTIWSYGGDGHAGDNPDAKGNTWGSLWED